MLRFRNDKSNGNHISVVDKILHSIQDGVSEEDLIEACPKIGKAWKKRIYEKSQGSRSLYSETGRSHPEPNREDEPALKRTKIDMEEPEPNGFGGSTTNHQNASKQNSGEFQDIPTYEDSDDE